MLQLALPPLSPRTLRRRGSLAGSPSPNHEWGIQPSGNHHEVEGYMSACASCTGSTRLSAPPATSFPYPSAYFTPRVVHAAAPLHTIQTTHTHVSRLSHFVIPPFPVAQHGVGRTFLRHQFLMGRERYRTHDPEGSQDEVSFSHISQLPSWHISEDSRPQV